MPKLIETGTQYAAQADLLRSVVPLLKEYTTKLGGDGNVELFQKLVPPAKRLAQFVSQRINNLPLDDVLHLELELRLAEFEAAVNRASKALSAGIRSM